MIRSRWPPPLRTFRQGLGGWPPSTPSSHPVMGPASQRAECIHVTPPGVSASCHGVCPGSMLHCAPTSPGRGSPSPPPTRTENQFINSPSVRGPVIQVTTNCFHLGDRPRARPQAPLPLGSGLPPRTGSEAGAQRGSVVGTESLSSPGCSWDPRGSPISLAVPSPSLSLFSSSSP